MISIDLSGQIALVTGASRGIGRGISETLADAGALVVINYKNSESAAEETVEKIKVRGGKAVAIKADVGDYDQVRDMVEKVRGELGEIDILVNNAGITSVNSIETLEPDEWDRIFKVNFYGTFNCSKIIAEYMVKRKSGVIINITSTGAFTGGGGGPHYSASKEALHGFTRALARELAPHGIRVNAVAPTLIESDFLSERYPNPADREGLVSQVPVGRLGQPEDVGYITAYLASPLGSYINSEIIILDGGRTFR
jgi:3-oxoacyl-[acyl-carrier protein] reductase